jgi:hypothetical protein
MTGEFLRQVDVALSKCGRPLPPFPGVRVVPISRSFKAWAVFNAPPATLVSTVPTTISGDTTWMLRAISSYVTVPVGLGLQFQFPDGKFLFHDVSDIRCIAGFGSWRYPLTKERACPPGTKIIATFNTTTPATAQAIPLLLEGAYYFHVRDTGGSRVLSLASSLPRYAAGTNQNILAPCWAFGEGPQAPQGFVDEAGGFTYCSERQAIDVGAATPKNQLISLQVENGSDLVCRNLFFNVTQDAGVTGADVLVKVRDSSGYAFTDDYVQYNMLNGVPWLKDWIVKGGSTIFIDLALVDYSGAGNVYVQVFASGTKRRRS